MRSTAASGGMMLAAVALAIHAPTAQATPARLSFPPMALGDALVLLAQRCGRNILFTSADVAGLRSPAINAAGFDEALAQITRATGLIARPMAGGAVRLLRPAKRPQVARRTAPRLRATPAPDPGTILVQAGPEPGLALTVGLDHPTNRLLPDQINRLPDRTLAEALGRLPGMLTLATSLEGKMGRIDHAGRAVGDFMAMRGLPGSMVETRIDGVELPQSLPYNRGSQLGMMAGTSGTSLQVHRTLDAAHSGEAIAGLIELNHEEPFSPAVAGLRLGLSLGMDDFSRQLGQRWATYSGSLSYGLQSADGRLALWASAQGTRQPFTNVEQTYQSGNLGFAIATASGANPDGFDPAANMRLAAVNVEVTRGETRDASAHLALGWRASARLTLTARATWAMRAVDQDVYQISAQGGRSPEYFTQIPGDAGLYTTTSARTDAHYWFQTNPERDYLTIGTLRADWHDGTLTWQAQIHGALGGTDRPDHIEISFWDPVATRLSGGIAPTYRQGLPVLALAPADATMLADPLAYPIHNQGERESEASRDQRVGAQWSGQWQANERLRLTFGAMAQRSDRWRSTRHDVFSGTFADRTTLEQTGLAQGMIGPLLPGIYDYRLPVINDAALQRALRGANIATKSADDIYGDASSSQEDKLAAYLTMAWQIAPDWSLYAGLRAQDVRLTGQFWLAGNNGQALPGIPYGWNRYVSRHRAILPSLGIVWRASPRLRLEGALWTAQTRPSPYQLSGNGGLSRDEQDHIITPVPNPALKAMEAVNLDLTALWSAPDGLSFSLTGFAKELRNYLYDSGDFINNPSAYGAAQGNIRTVQPRNGGRASLRGIESAITVPLKKLGPPWQHTTLGADLTLLDSTVRLDNPALAPSERSQYAPANTIRLWLRYDDGRLSADIAFRRTSAYVQEYGLQVPFYGGAMMVSSSALDTWVRANQQLDLGMALTSPHNTLRLTLRNVLNDTPYRATLGRYTDTAPQTILGGRQVTLNWLWRP